MRIKLWRAERRIKKEYLPKIQEARKENDYTRERNLDQEYDWKMLEIDEW